MAEDNRSVAAVDHEIASREIAEGGNLRFYARVLMNDPGRLISGVCDSLWEAFRFVFAPRFDMGFTFGERFGLLLKYINAELHVPGATTLLETLWLTYLASQSRLRNTVWVEVGCFKGLSTSRLSLACRNYGGRFRVYDTFCGLPTSDNAYQAVDGGDSAHFKSGSYAGSLEEVRSNVTKYGAGDIVTYHPGDVRESLRDGIDTTIGFAFLDVDLVESYKTCFRGLASGIQEGTVIVMHEAMYKEIRSLIEDHMFWTSLNVDSPSITYVGERYKQRFLRGLAMLSW